MKTKLLTLSIVCIASLSSGCQTEMEETIKIASSDITTRSINSYSRDLTEDERESLTRAFPQLNLSAVKVTGPATASYNCIAYSLGIRNQWINPPQSEEEFADLYYKHGYDMVSGGFYNIIGYGSSSRMLHASVRTRDWESKLGKSIRIAHPETANFEPTYGSPKFRFAPITTKSIQTDSSIIQLVNITLQEKQIIQQKCLSINKGKKQQSDTLFNQWIKNWETNPETMFSNDTQDAKQLEEYPQLLAMGKEILPLVVEQLLDEKNFVGLVLYDELQDNPDCKIVYDYIDPIWMEGEANRAKRTVKLWVKSVTEE